MSVVDRHKKPGGFRKLVNSLETTPPDRRAKILESLRKEDPDFTAEVEQCLFNFEDFMGVNDMIIAEVVFALENEPRTLALALFKAKDEALAQKFLKCMRPKDFAGYKEVTEQLTSVLAREQIGARFRIIAKARELEVAKKFTLKRYSKNYRDE